MLRDCTFGKYIPENSPVHTLDPRVKILFFFLYSLLVFFVSSFYSFLTLATVVCSLIFLSKIKILIYLKSIKIIVPVLLLTCISNLVFASKNDVFFNFFCFYLPKNISINCLIIAFRMTFVVILNSIVSFTTTPSNLTKALKFFIGPLKYIKVKVEDIAMIITLTLRFVPLVLEQNSKIIDAQKIRGADFNNKNIIKKIKSYNQVIVPTIISLLNRTNDITTAMENRCYTGENRTCFKKLKFNFKDILATMFLFSFFVLVVLIEKESGKSICCLQHL